MKKNLFKRTCTLLLLIVGFWMSSKAQLNGTYSINSGAAASATNYLNLGSAVSDMMSGTRADGGPINGPAVSGPVTLRFAAGSGPYTQQVTIGAIPGASSTNTIRITGGPTMETIQFTGTTTADRHVIKLVGSRHITLDSLTILNNDISFGYGVHLTTGADSNIVSNCVVTVNAASTSTNFAGITISGTTVAANGDFGDDNLVQGNVVTGGYYGITARGTSTTVFAQRNHIRNNVLIDYYYYGVYHYYQNLGNISNNTFTARNPGTTSAQAIYLYYNDRFICEANKITGQGLYGIYVFYGNWQGGASSSRAKIVNNMIGGGWTNTAPNGIYLGTNSINIDIYHNSISLDNGNGRGINIAAGSGNDVRNNVFSVTGSTTGYALYVTSAANVTLVDYNDYWAPGSSNFIYIAAAYSTATYVGGGGYNNNSINTNPNFAGPQDLHIASGVSLYDTGANLGVTVDFDGQARPLVPSVGYDIGADEFSPALHDAGVVSLAAPVSPFPPGIQNVDLVIRNYGAATLTSATVNWEVNAVPQVPFPWVGSLASGTNSAPFTVGSYNFLSGSFNTLKAWTSSPNGNVDVVNSNDTMSFSVCPALSGAYTVGGVAADFPTINSAVAALICGGVSGPVTMNLVLGAGPFNEQVIIPPITGASATNTIRFNGGALRETVQFTGTTTNERAVIKLNGARHVILDSLTIINNDLSFGYGVHITNGADSNFVKNSLVTVDTISTSANFAGITISGTTVTTNGDFGDDNTIEGNTVNGGYYGITARGTSTTVYAQRNHIRNNIVRNIYYYGIYHYYQNLGEINKNVVSARPASSTAAYGIYLYYNDRFRCEGNKVANWGTYGIYVFYGNWQGGAATTRSPIVNNMVGGGWSGTTPYGIYLATNTTNIDVYHNSISLDNGNGRAIYITSGSGNDLRNNAVSVTGSTTGYALYVTSTAYVTIVDYNDYWVPGSSNFIYIGVPYSTATFVGGGGYNTNSINTDPNFVGPQDLHIGFGVTLYDAGANVGVTTDFDGDTRPLLPSVGYDIGADEFSPALNDAGVAALTNPAIPFSAGLQNVDLVIRNFGVNTLTSATVNWEVNSVLQAPYAWLGSLPTATNSAPFTVGTFAFLAGTSYDIKAWTSSPNGSSDAVNTNDTMTFNVCVALNGAYTVGGVGADFPTVNSAVDALLCGGVNGPVSLNLTQGAGPFNEQVIIPPITGASATNTIRFNGGALRETVQFTGTNTNERAVIKLNGASHIILDSLTIINNDLSFGHGVHITNSADSNIVRNCMVTVDQVTTSSNFAGIVISGLTATTAGDNGDGNLIENNVVTGGYYGITMRGPSTTVFNFGNHAINNQLINTYYYAMYIYSQTGSQINRNVIRMRTPGTTAAYGIYLGYTDLFQCNRNDIQRAGTYGIYSTYGNYQGGFPIARASIANNMIGGGFRGTTPYGIYITTNARDLDIFHNSVSLDNGNGRALYILSGTGADVRNNSFSVTNSTTGYATYISATSYVNAVNYNNYYAPGSSNFVFIGVAYSTATVIGGGGYNTNSRIGDPNYINPVSDLHAFASQLFDAGDPTVGVTVDFDGDVRPHPISLIPDIGADEYVPDSIDIAVIEILDPVSNICPDSNQVVRAVITNKGLNTQVNIPITANITGAVTATVSTTYPGPIVLGAIDTVVVGTFNSWPGGSINVQVISALPGDQNLPNDTLVVSRSINVTPPAPAPVSDTICAGDSTSLVSSNPGNTYWFDAQTGGNLVASGDTLHTGPLSGNTSFFVEARGVATSSLTTLFASNNNGSAGGINYFDLTVGPNDVTITGFDVNTSVTTGPINVAFYTKVGTSVGFETNSAAWTLSGNATGPTGMGTDNPTPLTLGSNVTLSANTTYGIALIIDAAHEWRYTNGTGSNQNFSNTYFSLSLGAAANVPWTATIFSPRVWNGSVHFLGEGCASPRTEVTVDVINYPVVMVPDTAGCDSITLDAGNAGMGFTYNWSTGDTTQTVTVSASSTYFVTVTNTGCGAVDSSLVTILPAPAINLGPDQQLCNGSSAVLDAGSNPGGTFLWSTGDTTQTISVSTAGSYSVDVSNSAGCMGSDTMVITTLNMPSGSIASDTSGCPLINFTASNSGDPATAVTWDFGDGNTGAGMTASNTYATNGSYTVTLVMSNSCGTDSVTLTVVINCIIGVTDPLGGMIALYPNPTHGLLSLDLHVPMADLANVELVDLHGRTVQRHQTELAAGENQLLLDLGGLSSGVYFVRVQSNYLNWVGRVVKE